MESLDTQSTMPVENKMSIESVVRWANKLKKNLWWRHAIRLAAEKGE